VLEISAGHWSLTGPRERNEDFVGLVEPSADERARKGVVAVIADGVSGPFAREASEHCARNVLADYYATPEVWPALKSLGTLYKVLNRWVLSQASSARDRTGMATTLSSLVLRGASYYFAHVGDTRIYLLRKSTGELQQLTFDHVWTRPEMEHVLTRAIGLDSKLTVDFGMGALKQGDVFALVTDGAWAKLSTKDLHALINAAAAPNADVQACARRIVETALQLGSQDNTTALVVRIDAIGNDSLPQAMSADRSLPALPLLAVGSTFDGMFIDAILHQSRTTLVYKVRRNARTLVLKTLMQDAANDPLERNAFSHEIWLAKRLNARFFAEAVEPADSPSGLYALSVFHEGRSLAQTLQADHHFTIPEALRTAMDLARALGALHRRSVIHRDVKPENVHLGADGQLRLLDLGVALSSFDFHGHVSAPRAGTPSFIAPELFADGTASARSDLFSWGVTVYWMLTRKYPYGEIEPFQTPRFAAPVPPSRYRPDIPGWFENVVLRALAIEPTARYETAEEMLLALERGPTSAEPALKPRPLMTRGGLLAWKLLAVSLGLLNLFFLYLLYGR
jgi:serine/threonine protein phosphatase PrpC